EQADKDKDIFAIMEISDSIAYPGQQVILQYKLFTRKNISNYNFRTEPDLTDFKVIELNNDTRGKRQIVKNSEYTVFTLKKMALFPQKTGIYHLDGANIVLQLPDKRSRNVFFRSTKPYPVTTNDKTLKIIALPENAPENFSGNTGKFNIYIKTDKRKVSTDDAVSLKLQIISNYPSKFIEAPKISSYLKDFEIYDPKVIGQKNYEESGFLKSKKTFEYLLVPQKPGKYEIKIPYVYFNVDSAKYVTIYSNSVNLKVVQGKNIKDKKSILAKYRLSPPMLIKNPDKRKKHFFNSLTYWILLILLLSSIPVMYFYRRYLIKKENIDPVILKRKKAAKIALKRLKNAKMYMEENKMSEFYKEISDALLKYVADKLNIPTIELSKNNVKSKLEELNVSKEHIEEYIKLLETCEVALYASSPNKNMQSIYNKTTDLLTEIESEF
ncbi:MAG TPA: hypothetical protein ENK91_04305, partial [Bacteroidetes bacterium]|nr:hypothetical protein [Bacteroidota bacterium]